MSLARNTSAMNFKHDSEHDTDVASEISMHHNPAAHVPAEKSKRRSIYITLAIVVMIIVLIVFLPF
jgi:hypothetical protein